MGYMRGMEMFGRHLDGAGPWGGGGDIDEYDYCRLKGGHTCRGELRRVQTHVDDEMTVCELGELVARWVVEQEGGYLHYDKLEPDDWHDASDYFYGHMDKIKEENGWK